MSQGLIHSKDTHICCCSFLSQYLEWKERKWNHTQLQNSIEIFQKVGEGSGFKNRKRKYFKTELQNNALYIYSLFYLHIIYSTGNTVRCRKPYLLEAFVTEGFCWKTPPIKESWYSGKDPKLYIMIKKAKLLEFICLHSVNRDIPNHSPWPTLGLETLLTHIKTSLFLLLLFFIEDTTLIL